MRIKAPSTIRSSESWPPSIVPVLQWRQQQLIRMMNDATLIVGAMAYYRTRPIDFINHWVDTYDPRNVANGRPARVPFRMFQRQADLIMFLQALIEGEESGLIEKCRDMGATWACVAFSVWLFLFSPGSSIGWGSRKEMYVDRLGDPDSIFEKIRMVIDGLPWWFLPEGFGRDNMHYMKITNPVTGSTITGEAGRNIGRGGRKSIYFKDESAHYEHPESIEAALGDNTRVQVDISSVNGPGNVFHRRRENATEWTGGKVKKGEVNLLIMDWRDHPAKDDDWYETRRKRAEEDGLLHVFEREVNRNYYAAVEGIIIPADWVKSAIDAHKELDWVKVSGGIFLGVDVADEGGDLNAVTVRRGPLLLNAKQRGEGDVGETTRWAMEECEGYRTVSVQYDSIGVGAGVKSEANRLRRENLISKGVTFSPWNAGANPLNPDEHLDPDDPETPLIRDFYSNLKAQGWWELRRRFERTHLAVTKGLRYNPDDMVFIPGDLPFLRQLEKELSQATIARTANMKLKVNKAPEGTKSPNLADAMVMCYWPAGLDSYSLENV